MKKLTAALAATALVAAGTTLHAAQPAAAHTGAAVEHAVETPVETGARPGSSPLFVRDVICKFWPC